jgi:hypothetical protein
MKKIFLIMFVSNALISCGGGGGGGGQSTAGGSSQPSMNLLDFTSATMALPTLENGEKVEETVAVNQQNQYSINSVSNTSTTNSIFIFHKLTSSFNSLKQLDPYALNAVQSVSCDYGGSAIVNLDGNWSDENLNAIVAYVDCVAIEGITISGTLDMSLSDFNYSDDDYDKGVYTYLTNIDLVVDDPSLGATTATMLAGTRQEVSYLERSLFGFTIDMKITSRQVIDGLRVGMENVNVQSKFSIFSSYEMFYRSGRFYISDLTAYVDYDESYDMSLTPFIFDIDSGEILSGEAHFLMANGGKTKIVGTGGEPITYVDSDGDGIYELIEN